jgi:hypothetical protein
MQLLVKHMVLYNRYTHLLLLCRSRGCMLLLNICRSYTLFSLDQGQVGGEGKGRRPLIFYRKWIHADTTNPPQQINISFPLSQNKSPVLLVRGNVLTNSR